MANLDEDYTRAMNEIDSRLSLIIDSFAVIRDVCFNYEINPMHETGWHTMSKLCEEIMEFAELLAQQRGR